MDKDLLRLVIFGVGVAVVIGMLVWSYIVNRKSKRRFNFYDDRNPLDHIDESLVIKTGEDDFDIVPLGSALADDGEDYGELEQPGNDEAPAIIQFSIIANNDKGFKGSELLTAFESVGLNYSNMNIYQQLDAGGQVVYAVANMVEPGTFPEDMEDFYCPGIVFFMQPGEFDNPLEAYDDLIADINQLSSLLDGIEWDSQRQPLTIETVQSIRNRL